MGIQYGGYNLVPGMGSEFLSQERQLWWGREQQQVVVGGILDKDTVDSGNSTTTILRPGLALARLRSSGQLTHWNPYSTEVTAADGARAFIGFFLGQQAMEFYGTTTERLSGAVLTAGNVHAASILIPGQSDYGLSGDNYEFLLREAMRGRFNVDDDLGYITGLKTREIIADTTLTTADHNTWITNIGDTDGCTITLPAPVPGLKFFYKSVVDQDTVFEAPSTGEYFIAKGTANSDTITGTNDEWVCIEAIRTATTPTFQYIIGVMAEPT